MPDLIPFLWFDTEAEEAARFYVSIFPSSKVTRVDRYPEGSPAPAGSVMLVHFELDGKPFVALNGGPQFQFNEAFSVSVVCDGQEEADRYWQALTADGGTEVACGWLKDRFGLSWQINPRRLLELLADPDPERAARAMASMQTMKRIDVAELERAVDGA